MSKRSDSELLMPFVLEYEEEISLFIYLLLTNRLFEIVTGDSDQIEVAEYSLTGTHEDHAFVEESDVEINDEDRDEFEKIKNSMSGKILKDLLSRILEYCKRIYAIYVPYYDDKYYRSSFSLHYYGKHFIPNSRCGRVFLFDGDKFDQMQHEVIEAGNSIESASIYKNSFIGSVVIKPIQGMEIGRTLIDPRYLYPERGKFVFRTAYYSETMYGIRLHVHSFPYAMQDGETVTCSEITIQNMADYFSKRYQSYSNIYPDEIIALAEESSYERSLPSKGLTYRTISRIFMKMGFAPILYASQYDQENFLSVLCAYLASGIPVAIGMDDRKDINGHSVIVMGKEADVGRYFLDGSYYVEQIPDRATNRNLFLGVLGSKHGEYIIMDDGRAPYTLADISSSYFPEDETNHWKIRLQYGVDTYEPAIEEKKEDQFYLSFLIAPLSKEMSMDALSAIQCFKNLLGKRGDDEDSGIGYLQYILRYREEGNEQYPLPEEYFAGDSKENPLLLRIFLCPSRSLKRHRVEHAYGINEEWLDEYRGIHMPRFVWVCELYSIKSITDETPFSIGEIVLDASSSGSHYSDLSKVILINYPGRLLARRPDEREDVIIHQARRNNAKKRQDENNNKKEFDEYLAITPFKFYEKW